MNDISDLHVPVSRALSLVAVWMVLYRKGTGKIFQVMLTSPHNVAALLGPETGSCEVPGVGLSGFGEGPAYIAGHYVDETAFFPQIKERTPCPATLEGQTFSGLPVPAQIEISVPGDQPRSYATESSTVEIGFDHVGEYTVHVISAKHLPGVYTVNIEEKANG